MDINTFRQKALEQGYSEDEINSFIEQRSGTKKVTGLAPGYGEEEEKARNWMLDLLPMAGGAIGGMAGSAVAPGVGTVGGAVAGSAGGEWLAQKLAGEETDYGKIATEGAWGLAGAGIGKGASLAAKGGRKLLGKGMMAVGDNLALRAIKPSGSQVTKFAQKTGKDIGEYVVEKGFMSGNLDEIDEVIKAVQGQYDDVAVKSGIKIKVKDVAKVYQNKIKQLRNLRTGNAQKLADEIEKEAKVFFKGRKLGNDMDLSELVDLRRQIDDLIPPSQFNKSDLGQNANKHVRNLYKKIIDTSTQGKTGTLGKELNELYEFRKIVERQSGNGRGTNLMGLLPTIGATGGVASSLADGNPDDLARNVLLGMGLPALANNPKVISYVAKTMIKGGKKVMPKAGQKGLEIMPNIVGQVGAQNVRGLFSERSTNVPQQGEGYDNGNVGNNPYNNANNTSSNQPEGGFNHGANDTMMPNISQESLTETKGADGYIYRSDGMIFSSDKQWLWDENSQDWVENEEELGDDKSRLENAIRNATDKKQLDFLVKQYQTLYPKGSGEGAGGSALTEGGATDLGLANSGMRSLETIKQIISDDPNILTKELMPGKFFSRSFDSEGFKVADAILRMRTGAAAPETEIRRYMGKFLPTFGDDEATVQLKLQRVEQDLIEAAQLAQRQTPAMNQMPNIYQESYAQ